MKPNVSIKLNEDDHHETQCLLKDAMKSDLRMTVPAQNSLMKEMAWAVEQIAEEAFQMGVKLGRESK